MEKRESRRGSAINHVKPLLPLLSALVHTEMTSLGSEVVNGTVHFSGFDCSSTLPPIDSLWGSIQHREAEIGALSEALDQVHTLLCSVENKEEIVACLQSMINFLRDMEKREGADLRGECSRVRAQRRRGLDRYWSFDLADNSFSCVYRPCQISGPLSDSRRQPKRIAWILKSLLLP